MEKIYKPATGVEKRMYYSITYDSPKLGDQLKYNRLIIPDNFPNLCSKKYISRRSSSYQYYINDRDIESMLLSITRTLSNNPDEQVRFYFEYKDDDTEYKMSHIYMDETTRRLTGYLFFVHIEIPEVSGKITTFGDITLTTRILW